MSKGKFIYDNFTQNKIKVKIKKIYNIEKSNDEDSISLNSLYLSSDSNVDTKLNKKKHSKLKKSNKKNKNKKYSKKNLIKKDCLFQKVEVNHKDETKIHKKDKGYNIEIKDKIKEKISNKAKEKKRTSIKTFKNDKIAFTKDLDAKNSKKANISSNNIDIDNNSSVFSKKITKKIFENESFDFDINSIKPNKHIYNKNEVEYEINKNINKSNIFYTNNNPNNIINNNSNKNLYRNNEIHKKKSVNNKSKNKNKETKIINQILGIRLPNKNTITNNLTTTSSKQFDNKDNFNTNEKINNI